MQSATKPYEVDVEMTVRRTLRVWAPSPNTARAVAQATLEMTSAGHGELSSVLKWSDERVAYRPMPVEKILSYRLIPVEPVEII